MPNIQPRCCFFLFTRLFAVFLIANGWSPPYSLLDRPRAKCPGCPLHHHLHFLNLGILSLAAACWLRAEYLFTWCFPSSGNSHSGLSVLCASSLCAQPPRWLFDCTVSLHGSSFFICFLLFTSVCFSPSLILPDPSQQSSVYFFLSSFSPS